MSRRFFPPLALCRRFPLVALGVVWGCVPSFTPAPLDAPCEVQVVNYADTAMTVTAFGRTIMELGSVEPGGDASFEELCRVERVSIRAVPSGGGQAVWLVAIMKVGKTVRVDLGS